MITSKVFTDRERIVCPNTTTDGLPALFHQGFGTRKLEIVNVDDQEHFPLLMPEATTPIINGRKANRLEVSFAMGFPVPPRVRMSVKGKDERTHRIPHVFPCIRPLFPGQADPCRITTKFGLCVRLLSIRLLNVMSFKRAEQVAGFSSLHSCRTTREILKHGDFPVLVFDLISLEDDTSFILSSRITERKLGALLDAYIKDTTDVHLGTCLSRLSCHVRPFTDAPLIPSINFTQPTPLLFQGCTSTRTLQSFPFGNGSGDASLDSSEDRMVFTVLRDNTLEYRHLRDVPRK